MTLLYQYILGEVVDHIVDHIILLAQTCPSRKGSWIRISGYENHQQPGLKKVDKKFNISIRLYFEGILICKSDCRINVS